MDEASLDLADHLVGSGYIRKASDGARQHSSLVRSLLSQRALPAHPWSDLSIEALLAHIAQLDSNNDPANVGVGEREGRVFSSLVRRRNFSLAHGIGRSGDIAAAQPKAAGSSLLVRIVTFLALHAIRVSGVKATQSCIVLPLATGMGLALSLMTLRTHFGELTAVAEERRRRAEMQKRKKKTKAKKKKEAAGERSESSASSSCLPSPPSAASFASCPDSPTSAPSSSSSSLSSSPASLSSTISSSAHAHARRYVLWPRIDQKTCLKAIVTAGLVPVVMENKLEGDQVRTDLAAIEAKIEELGAENVLCVVSTTSCFAPRVPDRVEEIAILCARVGIGHVINNAYGLQCSKSCHLVESACRSGRVDCFVQSTDKNFMVPVGGSIVASTSDTFVQRLSQIYPGRASSSPLVDLFITLLSMGAEGYKELLRRRKELYCYYKAKLTKFASKYGERVLETPVNGISFGITVDRWGDDATLLGSKLFTRCCSGARCIGQGQSKSVCGISFAGYGSHMDAYPHKYVTVACAIGCEERDIDVFVARIEKCYAEAGLSPVIGAAADESPGT